MKQIAISTPTRAVLTVQNSLQYNMGDGLH